MTRFQRNTGYKDLLPVILITGLAAGIADGIAAIINFYISTGNGPAPVFMFIASGIFGKEAYINGSIMIVWGILIHLLIAFFFTVLFFLLYPKLGFLQKNRFITAMIYGLFVWLVMNFIGVPASKIPRMPFHWDKAFIALFILIICIGLPLSLSAKWYYTRNGKPGAGVEN